MVNVSATARLLLLLMLMDPASAFQVPCSIPKASSASWLPRDRKQSHSLICSPRDPGQMLLHAAPWGPFAPLNQTGRVGSSLATTPRTAADNKLLSREQRASKLVAELMAERRAQRRVQQANTTETEAEARARRIAERQAAAQIVAKIIAETGDGTSKRKPEPAGSRGASDRRQDTVRRIKAVMAAFRARAAQERRQQQQQSQARITARLHEAKPPETTLVKTIEEQLAKGNTHPLQKAVPAETEQDAANTDGPISTLEQRDRQAFDGRTFQIATAAMAGKSRWGEPETRRAIAYASTSSPTTTSAKPASKAVTATSPQHRSNRRVLLAPPGVSTTAPTTTANGQQQQQEEATKSLYDLAVMRGRNSKKRGTASSDASPVAATANV